MRPRCGRIIQSLCENTLSTRAEVAGVQNVLDSKVDKVILHDSQTALHFPFDAWKFRKANLMTRGGITALDVLESEAASSPWLFSRHSMI